MKKEYPDILKLEGEKWHNPDPATGKLGTRVPAEWLQTTEDSLKSLTLEMLEVLKAAGINPNELNNTQVRDAIQKMILSRVINYNDIQGRPVVKDSLGDDRNNPASQRVVNDVNRDVVTAQKTANTANDKANAAQTTANQAKSAAATADSKATSAQSKADSAYSLANSKQDKLEFVGFRDGKALREGAFGIGGSLDIRGVYSNGVIPSDLWGKGTCFGYGNASDFGLAGSRATLILSGQWGDSTGLEGAASIIAINKYISFRYQNSRNDEWSERQVLLTDKENQQIGVSQEWINVKEQRLVGVNYTNNTGKPIFISVAGRDSSLSLYINDRETIVGGKGSNYISAIIQQGERYKITASGLGEIAGWGELR